MSIFIIHQDQLLLRKLDDVWTLPYFAEMQNLPLQYLHPLEQNFFCANLTETNKLMDDLKWLPLRQCFEILDEHLFRLAGTAKQIIDWDRDHQFCGHCGHAMIYHQTDRAKLCPQCGLLNYPRISPCIMAMIYRDDEILLANAPHFPKGLYSVLAGFIEAGETAEEAVHREVMEEVGLKVKNLRYIKSQSWPFSNSLMLGFTAEYDEGEIIIDPREIADAKWFKKAEIPHLPGKISLAYELIQLHMKT